MWMIGLELGLVAILLLIVGLALRGGGRADKDVPPHE